MLWEDKIQHHSLSFRTDDTLNPISDVYVESVLTLVADGACPSVRAITAASPQITRSSVRAVVTRQTAVAPESVVQTHWKQQDHGTMRCSFEHTAFVVGNPLLNLL